MNYDSDKSLVFLENVVNFLKEENIEFSFYDREERIKALDHFSEHDIIDSTINLNYTLTISQLTKFSNKLKNDERLK